MLGTDRPKWGSPARRARPHHACAPGQLPKRCFQSMAPPRPSRTGGQRPLSRSGKPLQGLRPRFRGKGNRHRPPKSGFQSRGASPKRTPSNRKLTTSSGSVARARSAVHAIRASRILQDIGHGHRHSQSVPRSPWLRSLAQKPILRRTRPEGRQAGVHTHHRRPPRGGEGAPFAQQAGPQTSLRWPPPPTGPA